MDAWLPLWRKIKSQTKPSRTLPKSAFVLPLFAPVCDPRLRLVCGPVCDSFATPRLRLVCDSQSLRLVCDSFATRLRLVCDSFATPRLGPSGTFRALRIQDHGHDLELVHIQDHGQRSSLLPVTTAAAPCPASTSRSRAWRIWVPPNVHGPTADSLT